MFTVGDKVVYRAEGVCRISDIRKESFGAADEGATYYILTPVNDPKSVLFVPVENDRLVSMMRTLLSAEEIGALCASLREERMDWIVENRLRSNFFREVLSEGERGRLVVLLNTVTERIEMQIASGKKALSTDTGAQSRAAQLLFEEFSYTTDLASIRDVIPLLRGEIALKDKTE